jgi:branched-chain amino acid transport system substrate-binding protein
VRIGYIVSLTGAGKMPSELLLKGAELYLDEIHGKMAGKTVRLFVENDETNPAMAIGKVRKLVEEDRVNLINGVFFSHILYAIEKSVEKYQIPVVVATAAGDDATQRKVSKWIVRTSFSASQQTHVLGDYAYKDLKLRKVAAIGADIAFGHEEVGGFQRSFEQCGGQVIQKLWAPVGFSDFTKLLSGLRKDADAVFLCDVGDTALIIPKQLRELGYKKPMIGGPTSFDDSLLANLGDSALGAISAQHYTNTLDTPASKHFVELFQAKYHMNPSVYSENGYTSMMWVHKAVDALKGNVNDKAKLMDALKRVQLTGPRGPEKLDSFGNPVNNTYILKVEKANGKYVNKVIKTYPNVSQFWTWKPEEFLKQPVYSKEYPPCKYCSAGK